MKVKKLLFFFFILGCPLIVNAQFKASKQYGEETIKITVPSATVYEWFQLIERKGIILSYNPSIINLAQVRQIKSTEITVRNLLKEILTDYHLNIILSEPQKIILQATKKKEYTVCGVLREEGSAEKLYGGAIILTDENHRNILAISNQNGMCQVKLLEGKYTMEISYIGYDKYLDTIKVDKDLFFTAELKPIHYKLQEVSITPGKSKNDLSEVPPSDILSFNSSNLFSQIRILPGVLGASANGDLQVNGGGTDENLVLLDGIPVYHTNHINSMLPSFNGDAIKSVAFHKSFFPAQFEGRLSSVTDIKLKDGNKTKHSQALSLDMPSASAMFEGPIIKNKLSYMVGMRRSWLDFFDNLLSEENRLNHAFYDLNLKLSYNLSEKSELQAIAYKARDNYYIPVIDKHHSIIKWDNELYAIKFNTVYGNRLFHSSTIAFTSYQNRAKAEELDLNSSGYLGSGIKELTLTSEFSYNFNNIYRANWGIKGSFEDFNLAGFGDENKNRHQPISNLSLFYDNRIRISDKLLGQVGVNFISYLPKRSNKYFSIQPRFSLKYTLDENDLIYAGFSRMAQFYHYLRIDYYSLPTDFRMPSIDGFKPRTSDHYEIGWKHFFQKGILEVSCFYKDRRNILALKPESYPFSNEWSKYIMAGDGKSYGLRAYFFKGWGKFSLQSSYAYTRSLEWFSEIKDKGKLPAMSDIPHSFNSALSYKLTNRSTLSVGGILRSGRIIGNEYDFELVPENDFRKQRKPFNYRMDASYSYIKEFKKPIAKLLVRVGLYNIVGNPPDEDIIDFYTVAFQKNCLPYGSITIKF